MERKKNRILASICGVISSALIFYIIPRFFAKGVHDAVWGGLMLLLPAVVAVVLLHIVGRCSPRTVFWGLLVECAVALILHKPIGGFLGYQLHSFSWDFFDYIAYCMFTFGWSIAATLVQFVVLLALAKFKQK